MLSVTELARSVGVSRTTILYYERVGLLEPASRSDNGYRWYGDKEIERLEAIRAYRSYGLSITQLTNLLEREDEAVQEHILRDQFTVLEKEIQKLRQQQNSILKLLKQPSMLHESSMTKERWVEIMRTAGLSDEDRVDWHRQFEALEPDAHQEFLESLKIDAGEIAKIRAWSRS
jgi:DNA-binding transcriptional MerR regulator